MQLLAKHGLLDLGQPVVMGILNVTPDSFYDGGNFESIDRARARAHAMVDEGAAIIDVGGRSYAKHLEPAPEEAELRRVAPVLEALVRDELPVVFSIDTARWRIARLAVDIGASIINDCSGTCDPFMFALAARTGAALVLMHNPVPVNTGEAQTYGDVVEEVRCDLREAADRAVRGGVERASIVLDPGLEFGKQPHDDLALLQHFDRITSLGFPVLLAASRKHFLGRLTGRPKEALLPASLAAAALAIHAGAAIVRAHDVAETVEFIRVFRPNFDAYSGALGKSKAWTSTSSWPRQPISSRMPTMRSGATRKAASNASRGRI